MAVLEGSYLWSLFTVQPQLEGRFFRYLAAVLAARLRGREKACMVLSSLDDCTDALRQQLTFEDRKPYLPSMDITKKYRKAKEGTIFYKSGTGWRKRSCEVVGGFLVVYSGHPLFYHSATQPSMSTTSSQVCILVLISCQ